ncbi:calmodulin-lysine N-methyltransferase [Scaptodrosophila lebanonensis]|uniref:Calmodulin-lysine N-methyltransferase n=1 Tax=Drosophila lebanonensis TaxID=7225 RepID=A0A6J2U9Y8_DROLE|nr:calmodulin-lysine N-methyltransferase [Scaptodrosophila lebanonensis]XP_030384013.1 calmodulin-lysine N-methyltransferase [Scaptodrosophila lebanonensis]
MSATLVQKSTDTTLNSDTQQKRQKQQQRREATGSATAGLSADLEDNATIEAGATAAAAAGHLATISLLLQYDIDNTLNAFKEHSRAQLMKQNALMETAQAGTDAAAEEQSATTCVSGGNGNCSGKDNHSSGAVMQADVESSCTRQAANKQLLQTQTSGEILELEVADIVAKGGQLSAGGGCCIMPPTPPATPNLQNTAQKRWRILAKVLRKDSEETVSSSSDEFSEEQTASVRRFKSFDLLRQDSFEDHVSLNCLGKTENWYKYCMQLHNDVEYSVNIHHMERQLTANDLMGFNNTGNICVWPSEEALTALVLSDLGAYRGKWILELGGGFTSLAGLMLAKYAKPYAVHLTDGNEVSVENVKKTVCLNELSCYTKCSVLKWQEVTNRSPAEQAKFEFILCADCLFFDEARSALVDTIWYYLAPHGMALIMAPRRGRTLNVFREECMARGFHVELAIRYNETIWQRHLQLKVDSALYDEDLHYPLLLRLFKVRS